MDVSWTDEEAEPDRLDKDEWWVLSDSVARRVLLLASSLTSVGVCAGRRLRTIGRVGDDALPSSLGWPYGEPLVTKGDSDETDALRDRPETYAFVLWKCVTEARFAKAGMRVRPWLLTWEATPAFVVKSMKSLSPGIRKR